MRIYRLFSLIIVLALAAACGSAAASRDAASPVLRVVDGTSTTTYSAADLEAMPASQASLKEVVYTGVALSVLLEEAGFDLSQISAVKATAADGFSAQYDASLFGKADTLVAFARAGGPLADDEAPFRMVLPAEGGKLNPRQLVEIEVIR
jgi:DMSO/TMAO reductase YedYZ molybdopterin-dependent catalytic subunit